MIGQVEAICHIIIYVGTVVLHPWSLLPLHPSPYCSFLNSSVIGAWLRIPHSTSPTSWPPDLAPPTSQLASDVLCIYIEFRIWYSLVHMPQASKHLNGTADIWEKCTPGVASGYIRGEFACYVCHKMELPAVSRSGTCLRPVQINKNICWDSCTVLTA